MGVKVLQCFPWYRRCKGRGKGRHCPPKAVPSSEGEPHFSPAMSWSADAAGGGGGGGGCYFSHKARVAYRHQLEGNVIDSTY